MKLNKLKNSQEFIKSVNNSFNELCQSLDIPNLNNDKDYNC